MDIRIEYMAGNPPTWKVFLGTFFQLCFSEAEAREWAARAQTHEADQCRPECHLPNPMQPAKAATTVPLELPEGGARVELESTDWLVLI